MGFIKEEKEVKKEETKQSSSSVVGKISMKSILEKNEIMYTKDDTLLSMTTLNAPMFEKSSTRAPIDIIACIDISGSMAGSKIKLLISTLQFMVEQLKSKDRLGVITFETSVSKVCDPTECSDEGKKYLKNLIGKLEAKSQTNLSGGIFEGLQMVSERKNAREVVSVLVFTDGLATTGLTKTKEIISGISSIYDGKLKNTSCSLFCFGYGEDHDATMLKEISEAGNGMYYYLKGADEIGISFGNCLGGLLTVVAQNIKLNVEILDDEYEILSLVSDYKFKFIKEKKAMEISIGDLYSEEKKDLIFKLKMNKIQKPCENKDFLKISLNYFNVVSSSFDSDTNVLKVERLLKDSKDVNIDLEKQKNRILTADALNLAKNYAENNKLDEAKKILQDTIEKIKNSTTGEDKYSVTLIFDLKECLDSMQNKVQYENFGSKMLANRFQGHSKQRQNYISSNENVYQNANQNEWAQNFNNFFQQQK